MKRLRMKFYSSYEAVFYDFKTVSTVSIRKDLLI